MSGAATNPDARIFAYAAAQLKKGMDVAKKLGAVNYGMVLYAQLKNVLEIIIFVSVINFLTTCLQWYYNGPIVIYMFFQKELEMC